MLPTRLPTSTGLTPSISLIIPPTILVLPATKATTVPSSSGERRRCEDGLSSPLLPLLVSLDKDVAGVLLFGADDDHDVNDVDFDVDNPPNSVLRGYFRLLEGLLWSTSSAPPSSREEFGGGWKRFNKHKNKFLQDDDDRVGEGEGEGEGEGGGGGGGGGGGCHGGHTIKDFTAGLALAVCLLGQQQSGGGCGGKSSSSSAGRNGGGAVSRYRALGVRIGIPYLVSSLLSLHLGVGTGGGLTGSSSSSVPPLLCPTCHTAIQEHRTEHPSFRCDICGTGVRTGRRMFGCRRCDYDVCEGCEEMGGGDGDGEGAGRRRGKLKVVEEVSVLLLLLLLQLVAAAAAAATNTNTQHPHAHHTQIP